MRKCRGKLFHQNDTQINRRLISQVSVENSCRECKDAHEQMSEVRRLRIPPDYLADSAKPRASQRAQQNTLFEGLRRLPGTATVSYQEDYRYGV